MSWGAGLRSGSRYEPFSSLQNGAAAVRQSCARPARSVVMEYRSSWIGDFSGTCSFQSRSTMPPNKPRGHRLVTRMGKTAKDGPFTPIVVVVRNQLGTKEFNQLRGKAISLHSQSDIIASALKCCRHVPLMRQHQTATIIKDFGKQIGAEGKQVQGIIRLAKQNGEKLGFLS